MSAFGGDIVSSERFLAAKDIWQLNPGGKLATGGIFGIGAQSGALHWRASSEILAPWVITLPIAAVLAKGISWGLR